MIQSFTAKKKVAVYFKSTEKYTLSRGFIEIEMGAETGRTKNVITSEGIQATSSERVMLLSITGTIYEHGSREMATGGQCEDTFLAELAADNIDFARMTITREQLAQLLGIWEKWHLNDMTTGTPAQLRAVKEWQAEGNKYDYTAACEHLKSKGLLADASMANYKYGSAWLTRLLPENVQDFISSL